jgi:hypothetical protein
MLDIINFTEVENNEKTEHRICLSFIGAYFRCTSGFHAVVDWSDIGNYRPYHSGY